ncbi:MAG: glutathione S-transferase family protein [Alphaproteobacteria bacterium]|nr:glutathione S-transferase family protein [Alphaproteobacteria bacterium]
MPFSFCLHHHPLDPPSRRVRLSLAEKKLPFETVIEKPWDPRPDFFKLSPAGDVPTLVIESNNNKLILCNATAICEFLEETQEGPSLLGDDPSFRAEVRRLVDWFEHKMFLECTSLIVGEKAIKRLQGSGEPDSTLLRAGHHNIHNHMDYIDWLTEHRNWLAGDELTLADLAAAAQISCIDYLNDVPWERHLNTKEWYARIKSRPCFRSLLGDHIAGLLPPQNYANLDF